MRAKQPPKREWFCMWWPQTIALSLSFLIDSSLVWCSACVLVTTGSMKRYLKPNQVQQLVQLLKDGTSISVVGRFAVSPSTVSRAWRRYQETGCYKGRAGKGINLAARPVFNSNQLNFISIAPYHNVHCLPGTILSLH